MSRGGNLSVSRWFTSHNRDWIFSESSSEAACRKYLNLPWVEDRRPDTVALIKMREICTTECPVIKECAHYALKANDGDGVEGGFYAGVWIPWILKDSIRRSGYPGRETRHMRKLARAALVAVINPKIVPLRKRAGYHGRSKPISF